MAEAEAPKEPVVDSEEEDGDYVPVDDDEDAAEDELYEALEGGEDPDDPDCPRSAKGEGVSSFGKKRKAPALPGLAKRARAGGGICLSDDDGEPGPSAADPAEEEGEEEDVNVGAEAHVLADQAPEEAKPKPKSAVDDMFEEMKRGAAVKKDAPKPRSDISSFINSLVSKSAPVAASKGAKVDVASLFPTTVAKKATVQVEQKVDFAGKQVKITKDVEVGSKEHEAIQKKKGKGNLDDLVARLTGKQKSITTLTKTEHDWGSFKKEHNLEDELSTYRKNGYLEKMKFLKKTDDHLEAELKEQRQKEREARARAQHAANLAAGPGM